jgi:hypothetical protein
MSISSYLEAKPLSEIEKFIKGSPKDSIPYTGHPRQHPSEKDKLILIHDPLGRSPQIMEFKIDDITHLEEEPSAITEAGEGVRLVKLWIRKGAIGVLMQPFEVQDIPCP